MSWKTWLCVGLGWASSGVIGALIGFIIGRAIDGGTKQRIGDGREFTSQQHTNTTYRNTGTQHDFDVALLVLIAAVMKADGEVRRSELNCVKRFLLSNYGEQRSKELLILLRDLVKKDINVAAVCQQIKVNTDYTTRYHMLDFLFAVAASDMDFDAREEAILNHIRQGLGINYLDFHSMKERHFAAGGRYGGGRQTSTTSYQSDPYAVLGIQTSATDDEVKKAYRRLAMKYHPDKVEGMSEEVKHNAEEQFKKINEAYETIKLARGMK